jgi:Lrp/AsnC family leucine-responsive transcriptional regulator
VFGEHIVREEELDRTDLRILERLQSDARASNAELSEVANLSPPQCYRRVKRMEDAGYIERYVALLDPVRMGFGVTAFVSVTLGRGRRQDLQKFKEIVATIPEILECHVVTGEADYLLKVVAKDLQAFSTFLLERLMDHFEVVSTKSEVSLEQIKITTALPLSA